MWPSGASVSDSAAVKSRQRQRFFVPGLVTDFGEVLDVSASGIRVNCRNFADKLEIGEAVKLTVRSNAGRVTVRAKAVRIKRAGPNHAEVAFTFVRGGDKTLVALGRLAGLV